MKNAALLRRLTSTLMSTPPEAPLSERLLRGFVQRLGGRRRGHHDRLLQD